MRCRAWVAGFVILVALLGGLGVGVSGVYASSDANGDCSAFAATEASPGFRTGLPDCRAYEMVTPPYQNGSAARWIEYEPPLISADGEHIIGLNIAAFGGTENDEQVAPVQTGAVYEFSRTSSGWQTEPLDPSATVSARNNEFQTASGDLSKSLWTLPIGSPSGEEVTEPHGYEYAVREGAGAGARFARVGPSNSPTDPAKYNELLFAGASSDLGHVAFSIFPEEVGQAWPGDTTEPGDRSLYEYVGTGNREPRLVGVRNEGPLDGAAHVNEGAELISDCGTSLGAEFASSYNAMSGDGEAIFFTASPCAGGPSVAELYARIGGSRTVSISEPSAEDCVECDESSPAEAVFQGASRDGSRVFFLSAQKGLLPGAEGQNLYEYDFQGPAGHRLTRVGGSVVEPRVLGVARVAEDGSRVYFIAEASLAGRDARGVEPLVGSPNLYELDSASGQLTFVATLAAGDGGDWSTTDARPVQASDDGRWLIFTSRARLTSDDESTEGAPQLFEFDAEGETLARVSIGQAGSYFCPVSGRVEAGFACDGNGSTAAQAPKLFAPPFYAGTRPVLGGLSIADTGAVFFSSLNALTPEAVVGGVNSEGRVDRENVYEYTGGNIYLLSPPVEPAPLATLQSHFLGASASGTDAFFFTTASLVPQDTDTQAGWYDARVGGGFPAPASTSGCAGDACQGSLGAAPSLPGAGGSSTAAGSNVSPAAGKPATPKAKVLTRAQQLTKALKACHVKKNRGRRRSCEVTARRRYGAKPASRAKTRRAVRG
jgi:hypothetical protein